MRDLLLLFLLGMTLLAAFRYPFAGLLLWAWFTIAAPQNAAYSAGDLSLQIPIAAVAIASLLLHGDFFRSRMNWQLFFIVAFTVWIFASQVMSLAPTASLVAYDRFWKVMLFVAICAFAVTDRVRFTALIWILVLIIGFYGVKGGLYTIATFGQNTYFGLYGTVLYDNNHLGIAMATVLPLMLYVALQATNRWVSLASWGVFGLTFVAIVGTYSRGAFVCLLVFGVLLWWQSKRKVLIGAAAALAGIAMFSTAPGDWIDRMGTITEASEDKSFTGRIDAWVINTKLAVENPFTGAGLRAPYTEQVAATVSERTPRAAHSIYFEILGGMGFVGLALYLGMWATGILSAWRVAWDRQAAPWRRDFGRYGGMSLIVFAVGGASVSMEMWEGYLIVLVLANAVRWIPDRPPAKQTAGTLLRERIRARAAGSPHSVEA